MAAATGKSLRRIVFVGDGNYYPNRQAVSWILDVLAPELASLGVDTPILIYGQGYGMPDRGQVQFQGYEVNNQNLYQIGDIHIAPVTTGAGMKSKVAIPLLAGLDVVATPDGMRGLMPSSRTIVSDLTGFAAAINQIADQDSIHPLNLLNDDVLEHDQTTTFLSKLRQSLASQRER